MTRILGVSGAQGSGKSSIAAALAAWLRERGQRVAVLSIDDLYRTRAERTLLGAEVHPLCAIRGLPGTHDAVMGAALLDALASAAPDAVTPLPRFDKSVDDRAPRASFPRVTGRPDVVLLEGWCVGARPGPPWEGPINEREARDDPDGSFVRWSEAALTRDYPPLWARLDALLVIETPSWEAVVEGRCAQERSLRRRLTAQGRVDAAVGLMSETEVVDYVALFERKTRQLMADLPPRADWLAPHWLADPEATPLDRVPPAALTWLGARADAD